MKSYVKFILTTFVVTIQLVFAASAQERPNIIWLMAEDIGPDLECYGMKAVKTPNLNKLAEEGIRYTNCFASNPICSPNRSSMMVGVYQNRINAGHHRSNRNVPLPYPYKPFTYWLRKAGYTTILGNSKVMGKGRKIDCNFRNTQLGSWDGKINFGLFDKYDEFTAQDQPFFSQIQLQVTHRGDWWDSIRSISPHPVNPDHVDLPSYLADHPVIRLDWAKYFDQIEYMDSEVGHLVEDLKQKGLYDNTVIIFIGDNGRCNIRGKGYLYDPGIHVPLIVHWPERIEPRQEKDDLISVVDITATILDLAGINIPDYMDGASFMKKDFHRDYVYSARDRWDDVPDRSRSLTTKKYKYILNQMPEVPYDAHQAYLDFYRPGVHVMRKLNLDNKLSEDQKHFFARLKPEEELYDLEKDPEELNNLAADHRFSSVLNKMREKLLREEKRNIPKRVIQHSVPSKAPVILDWVRYYHPEDYLRMLEGEEIGYQKFQKMYRAHQSGGYDGSSQQVSEGTASDGELIFQSGFEPDSKIIPRNDDSDVAGIDQSLSTHNDWINDLDNHPNIGNFSIQYQGGDSTMRYARIVAEPGNPENHVLHFWLDQPNVDNRKGRIQGNVYGNEGLKEIYQSVRMFLHDDFNTVRTYPDEIHWLTIAEFWNNITWSQSVPYRFRISLSIGKPTPDESDLYFVLDAQNCELYADGSQKYTTLWEETNEAVKVPIGKWFTMDYYYKEGDDENGRFYLSITPEGGKKQVVFDVNKITHNTEDPDPDGLGHFNPIKLYTSKGLIEYMMSRGKTLQIYWDDLKLWKNKTPQ